MANLFRAKQIQPIRLTFHQVAQNTETRALICPEVSHIALNKAFTLKKKIVDKITYCSIISQFGALSKVLQLSFEMLILSNSFSQRFRWH